MNTRNTPTWMALLLFVPLILFPLPATSAESGPTDDTIAIPVPPPFRPALTADKKPQVATIAAIKEDFREHNRNLNKFVYNPNLNEIGVIVPDGIWLKQLVGTYQAMIGQFTIKPEADTWDCENYSSLLNALATLNLWQQGYTKTRAAIGWLRVNARESWAGIPVGMHSLMFAVTVEGIYIIEPQNGSYTKLTEYPNRQFIEEVYLF